MRDLALNVITSCTPIRGLPGRVLRRAGRLATISLSIRSEVVAMKRAYPVPGPAHCLAAPLAAQDAPTVAPRRLPRMTSRSGSARASRRTLDRRPRHADAERCRHGGGQYRGARAAGRRDRRRRPAQFGTVLADRPGPASPDHPIHRSPRPISLFLRLGRAEPRPGLCPGQSGRRGSPSAAISTTSPARPSSPARASS